MAEAETIVRDCIICGSTEHKPVFSYTLDFLTKVRWQNEQALVDRGWTRDTALPIVKCNSCGCYYLREVLGTYQGATRKELGLQRALEQDEQIAIREEVLSGYTHRNIRFHIEKAGLVADLLAVAAGTAKRPVRMLDFGSGNAVLANLARTLGADAVTAYDPSYQEGQQNVFDTAYFPGIRCARDREEVLAGGPYDLVTCQGVIEHVLDPRAELKLMFDSMAQGGFLYINNPVMDLDREVGALRSATKIEKRHPLSTYHPKHYNYMMPKHFIRLAGEVGFAVTPDICYLPVPPMSKGLLRRNVVQTVKRWARYLQNVSGIPYRRSTFVLRKP